MDERPTAKIITLNYDNSSIGKWLLRMTYLTNTWREPASVRDLKLLNHFSPVWPHVTSQFIIENNENRWRTNFLRLHTHKWIIHFFLFSKQLRNFIYSAWKLYFLKKCGNCFVLPCRNISRRIVRNESWQILRKTCDAFTHALCLNGVKSLLLR